MTMPHLMNCSHSFDGWCLECVKTQWLELNTLQKQYDELYHEAINISEWLDGQPSKTAKAQLHRLLAKHAKETNAVTENNAPKENLVP